MQKLSNSNSQEKKLHNRWLGAHMDRKDEFYCQLARSTQAWLWIETEAYLLYLGLMEGANPQLISVTFHNIESFESKLVLLDSCLKLVFDKDSDDWKQWRSLLNKSRKFNAKRNKIVHQPIHTGVVDGKKIIEISPSFFNAQALVKGQTSHIGPVVGVNYKPSKAKLKEEHKIDIRKLRKFEDDFKAFARELRAFREKTKPALQAA
jgi:hypothetical protein